MQARTDWDDLLQIHKTVGKGAGYVVGLEPLIRIRSAIQLYVDGLNDFVVFCLHFL